MSQGATVRRRGQIEEKEPQCGGGAKLRSRGLSEWIGLSEEAEPQ